MAGAFAGRHFPPSIILLCVRWYCRYAISYRDLAEMMLERGVEVDPSTIFRSVQRYAPEIEKTTQWFRGVRTLSWRVDETYVKVGGKWRYLFRAIDSQGRLIDFKLMEKRSGSAAYRFLKHAVEISGTLQPDKIVTDKSGAYPEAIARLKREKRLREETRHRTTKYLNNRIEADHGALKQRIKPTRGFRTMPTARATLKGLDVVASLARCAGIALHEAPSQRTAIAHQMGSYHCRLV